MEKTHTHVSAHPDILSLENRCLATLPDLKITEKPHGHVSAHPDILSLENRCLATLPDLKTMRKPHGLMSAHPDILSLENRCLVTLPVLKSTMSASSLLQGLQISQRAQADRCSLNTSNHLLSEPPAWRSAQCPSEGQGLLTCPRALKSISATDRTQETALGCWSSSEEKKWEEAQMPIYNLSFVEEEEEEVEELALKLASGDSESWSEPTVQVLQQKKMALMNLLCSTVASNANVKGVCTEPSILEVCTELAPLEPEFILKASLYARQQLNLRDVANKVLAIAAFLPVCRPYLRRYFCAIVQLPSDWIQVAEIYQSLAGGEGDKLVPMPACLRAAMTDKFTQFDEYQLAKYNPRKHRAKRCPHRPPRPPKVERPFFERQQYFPRYLEPFKMEQEKFEETYNAVPEKKKPPAFTLKKLVQRLHIREPAQHVFSLLGYRYPSNLQAFSRSRLPGPWDSSKAGKRMKLSQPETWERELSLRGNKAAVWEELIGTVNLTITPSSALPIYASPFWTRGFPYMIQLFCCWVTGLIRPAMDYAQVDNGACLE